MCHLFGGVNDLVVALLLRTAERWIAHLTKGVIATKTGAEAIAALVDGHLEWVLAHRKAARFLFTRPWLWSLQAPSADALRSSKRN